MQSPPPTNLPLTRGYKVTTDSSAATDAAAPAGVVGPATAAAPTVRVATKAAARGAARIVTKRTAFVRRWQASGSNEQLVTGRLLLRGRAVVGARMRVGRYRLTSLTDRAGVFRYRADVTVARRLPHLRGERRERPDRRAVC